MPTSIKQRTTLPAPPAKIYRMLMNSKEHARFTGAPATIGTKVGDRFTAHGPYIVGFNVELIEGKRIVQAWRGSDWPPGAWSILSIDLERAKGGKTALTLTQHGVPPAHTRSIAQGWNDYYWEPMKCVLGE